jgi:CDP-glycerol glycerophosphotransferase (TagB/SpsB family)
LLDEKYAAGIDWRQRLAPFAASGRFALVEAADSSPYLAAADVMVTDHSSIGFEFLALDRPLAVFDAPDLVRVARINPEKVALLRSAATVAATAEQLADDVTMAVANPATLSDIRRRVAGTIFHRPGTATARAVALACELLSLPAPAHADRMTAAASIAQVPHV